MNRRGFLGAVFRLLAVPIVTMLPGAKVLEEVVKEKWLWCGSREPLGPSHSHVEHDGIKTCFQFRSCGAATAAYTGQVMFLTEA